VLLTGETGTGKDVLAHALHEQGPRAKGPFEVVDCGAVSPSLIESELFGHERGAFTGAVASRAGAFERAHGGTLFLDELGELPLDLQPKLLRALESREIRRVGGNKTLSVDVRVVAATTRDLPRAVRKGEFREDLYFRLAVVPIHVPPLRERLEDLPLLVGRMLENEPDLLVPDVTIAAMRAHDWPGNVRELRNVVERAAVMARASGETALRLYEPLGEAAPELDPEDVFRFRPGTTWREAKARVDALLERRYLGWLLERHGNNASAAAREAELDRKYLAELARKHGLLSRR
jgi:transcriptional regulator with GAF, ATPase, and Fis domain